MIRLGLFVIATLLATSAVAAQDYNLSWYTVDGGGETFSSGGNFELGGTIGQPDANPTSATMTGGSFELAGGFWCGVSTPFVPPCPGDLDGNYRVDLFDLAEMLGHYGHSGVSYQDGDLDQDGDVDLLDLAEFLGLYGTVCIDCPGDLDGDNQVGLFDLAQLLGHYGDSGASYEDGDLDGDGDVDLLDLAELMGVYGDVCW